MAKYTSDTKLIEGAATAYKNWDNVPGMYKGLEDLSKAGTDMMGEAVKGYEAEQEKIKKEKEKEANSRKKFNILSEDVLKKFDGSPTTTIYQDHIRKKLELLRIDLIQANKTNDQDLMSSVKQSFSNISQDVISHKESRADLANISTAVGGDNLEILTAWGKEEFTMDKKGGRDVFVIDVGGKKIRKTQEELNDMMIPQDAIPGKNYAAIFDTYYTSTRKSNDKTLKYSISENVIPKTADGLHAYLSDPGFGMEEGNFKSVMNTPDNKEGITAYLKTAGIELSAYDTNDDATDDYKEFVDAIANPNNKFWKGDKETWHETSGGITAELLANITKNAWEEELERRRQEEEGGEEGALE
tara:strand:+ start:1113 stop:2183 length:1071 start_codon:yes stop_codon:yes gene_type:complete